MKSKQSCNAANIMAITVSARPAQPRVGTTHTYTLNGTQLRDVLVDGRWVTLSASGPVQARAA